MYSWILEGKLIITYSYMCYLKNIVFPPLYFASYNDINFLQEMKENKVRKGHIFAGELVERMMI